VAGLRERQERVLSPWLYEGSARAYILSGLSSHSCQRATAGGDSTGLMGLIHRHQTPSMVDILNRSQGESDRERERAGACEPQVCG
jgi:hypothetical protein